MERKLITTADGSHSLYVEGLDEHYHSIHGAIAEARHVFIKMGIQHLRSTELKAISILEIGFGTGLNALLSCLEAERSKIRIRYTSLETFPLTSELIQGLNYVSLVAATEEKNETEVDSIFKKLHAVAWEEFSDITENFSLRKIQDSLQGIKFTDAFDLIFFDAFGPRVQPEMWTEELFTKIYAATKPGGYLVTYCAKGEVKRTLKRSGYEVETLPGPPRKREMIRAAKH